MTFGVGVVAIFGAGVVVVRATLKVELEISEEGITEIQHWRYSVFGDIITSFSAPK